MICAILSVTLQRKKSKHKTFMDDYHAENMNL